MKRDCYITKHITGLPTMRKIVGFVLFLSKYLCHTSCEIHSLNYSAPKIKLPQKIPSSLYMSYALLYGSRTLILNVIVATFYRKLLLKTFINSISNKISLCLTVLINIHKYSYLKMPSYWLYSRSKLLSVIDVE